jgi:2-dehydro-3-deoxyphosphooctonate aldolase (KDO 8-P synthase)
MFMTSPFEISCHDGVLSVGGSTALCVICGPCVIESRDSALDHAKKITDICRSLSLPLVFKSSYDKANRTSLSNFRGIGIREGLAVLAEVREQFNVPVVTDVHSEEEARLAGEVVDVVQIPAFLCRQTDILVAAGRTGKAVLVKKGQFLAPEDMEFAAGKVRAGGSKNVLFCERGSCFGYRNLVVDMRGLAVMRRLGAPVVFDATHSVQVMGGVGGSSGGNRDYVPLLARAAVAAGVNGVFLEAHEKPESALSDGANMISLEQLPILLRDLKQLSELKLDTRF